MTRILALSALSTLSLCGLAAALSWPPSPRPPWPVRRARSACVK
jgi:predicted small lipoprotein YifL